MLVYIICPVYPPEPVVSATTSAQIAEELVRQGHGVKVITGFPNRPGGKIFPDFRRRLFSRQQMGENYEILRCFASFSPRSTLASRLLENLTFGVTAGLALLFSEKPEVIYANTWPILATGIIRLAAGLRKIPLVVSVQDLYPESLISQGRLQKNGKAYRLLLAIDRWISRGCRTLIVISDNFRKIYCETRKISTERINVIPNWIDTNSITPMSSTIYRNERGIPLDAFVLVYGGNVGMAAGVESVLQALEKVVSEREVYFIIAGSGSQLKACREITAKLHDVHVIFHSPWEVDETSKVLASADALVLPTRGDQSLASVPSKMLSYLLAARPIITQAFPDTETASVINKAGCGWIVPPGDVKALACLIREVSQTDLSHIKEMGEKGRKYACESYSKDLNVRKVINILISLKRDN